MGHSRGNFFCDANGESLDILPTESDIRSFRQTLSRPFGFDDDNQNELVTTESPRYMAGLLLFMKIFRQEHETKSSEKDTLLVCYMNAMHARWDCFMEDVDQKVKELKVDNRHTESDGMIGDG